MKSFVEMAKKRRGLRLFFLTVAAVIVVFPVVFMLSNSFMPADEAKARYIEYVIPENADKTINGKHFVEPTLIPSKATIEAYRLT